MNPMTFLFVVVILYTINAVLILSSGFEEFKVSSNVRLVQFILVVGMSIWGWFIYFS